MKLLIMLGLVYLAWRVIKPKLDDLSQRVQSIHGAEGEIEDVMIKDPQCGVYFPKQTAVTVRKNGEDLYFCSKECRTAWEKANS